MEADKNLIDALSYCAIRELPPKDKGEDVYIKALALTQKRDGSKGYAVLQKDENGDDRIIKDFGSLSQIMSIEEVYPFLYLDSIYVPQFETKKREERIKWLKIAVPEGDWDNASIKELNKAILNKAIKNQLEAIKNNMIYG